MLPTSTFLHIILAMLGLYGAAFVGAVVWQDRRLRKVLKPVQPKGKRKPWHFK